MKESKIDVLTNCTNYAQVSLCKNNYHEVLATPLELPKHVIVVKKTKNFASNLKLFLSRNMISDNIMKMIVTDFLSKLDVLQVD